MRRGDDLGCVNSSFEWAGVDNVQGHTSQSLGSDLSLGHAFVSQGQVHDAPEALALPFADIPGGVAVTDENDSDHVVFLHRDGNIVTCTESSVKMEHLKGPKDWESWIDQQIREAQERGAFDNLPGKGEPLDLTPNPYAQDRELAFKILKDAGYAPEWIELDKAIRGRLERARAMLARRREWLGARLSELADRSDRWSEAERQRMLTSWQKAVADFEEEIEAINREIVDLNLKVPSSRFQRSKIDAASEIARVEGQPL